MSPFQRFDFIPQLGQPRLGIRELLAIEKPGITWGSFAVTPFAPPLSGSNAFVDAVIGELWVSAAAFSAGFFGSISALVRLDQDLHGREFVRLFLEVSDFRCHCSILLF
jgi:hypothetical protein